MTKMCGGYVRHFCGAQIETASNKSDRGSWNVLP